MVCLVSAMCCCVAAFIWCRELGDQGDVAQCGDTYMVLYSRKGGSTSEEIVFWGTLVEL